MKPRYTRCALRAHHEGPHLFIYTTDPAAHYGECDAPDPATVQPVKLICAWCSELLRDGTLPASHGMCSRCRDKFEQDAQLLVTQVPHTSSR